MDAVIAHFQACWIYYVTGFVLVVPTLYFTRDFSMPVVQWLLEWVIYATIMHVVVHYFIIFIIWFKMSTTMYFNEKVDPGWQTPLAQFWKREDYSPSWLFYMELVFVVLVLLAMFRYRPMKTQKIRAARERLKTGQVPASLREGRSGGRPPVRPRPPRRR